MSLLTNRKACDICGSAGHLESLFSLSYAEPSLIGPLLTRYGGKVAREDIAGGSYELLHCQSCQFLFQRYVPNESLLRKIYTYPPRNIAESLAKRTHASIDYYLENALLVQKMSALLHGTIPHENPVLDFGMGWGFFLLMAKAHGFPAAGVEISEERKAFAREMGIQVFPTIAELKGRRFKYIHADQVFEHVPSPQSLLRELAPILDDGGVLYISVPDCRLALVDVRAGKVQLFRKSIRPLEHINGFTHTSLIKLARKVGLCPLSNFETAKLFFRQVSSTRNGHLLQAAFETLYRYDKSTSLYFVRESNPRL